MSKEQFVIEELQGLDFNLADGLGTAPDTLKNLQFDRQGGYSFYGLPLETTVSADLYPLITSAGFALYRNAPTTSAGSIVYLHSASAPLNFPAPTISPFTPSLSRAGISKINSIPGAIYAYKANEPGWVADDLPFVYSIPSSPITLTSGSSGTLPDGSYEVTFLDFIFTRFGAFVTNTDNTFINLSTGGTGEIIVTNPSSTKARAIYISDNTAGVPLGFVGIVPEAPLLATRSITISAPTDIEANSDAIFAGHHDVTVFHESRCYVANPFISFYNYGGPGAAEADFLNPVFVSPSPADYDLVPEGNRIYYSEVLTNSFKTLPTGLSQPFTAINMSKAFNYFDVPFTKSSRITALASSPAGLLIFSESEIFLFRGDPGASPSLVRFSGTIGCDLGKQVAVMGGVVFTIFNGEVYVISLGMGDVDFDRAVEKISSPVVTKSSRIEKIAVSPQENYLTVRNNNFKTFIYDFFNKKWFESPNSPADNAPSTGNFEILDYSGPNGVYYIRPPSGGNTVFRQVRRNVHSWLASGLLPDISFGFRELDFGDKLSRKLFRSVEVFTSPRFFDKVGEVGVVGAGTTATTIVDASGRKGWPPGSLVGGVRVQINSGPSLLRSVTSSTENSVTLTPGISPTPSPGDTYRIYPLVPDGVSMAYEIGGVVGAVNADTTNYADNGRLVFRLPINLVGTTGSFRFRVGQMSREDVIEPPIIFNYVSLSRRRI